MHATLGAQPYFFSPLLNKKGVIVETGALYPFCMSGCATLSLAL